MHVELIPMWVQIWGLSLGYYMVDFVKYLGAFIGPVEWVDWPIDYPCNLRFFRVRVIIKVNEPLFMGFFLHLCVLVVSIREGFYFMFFIWMYWS